MPSSSVDSGTSNLPQTIASISTTLRSPDGNVLTGNTADVGDNVIFRATFNGSAPSDYQWYRNGVAIEGANADSYEIGQISSVDDQALFSVRVSSAADPAGVSSQALTLSAAPTVDIDLLARLAGRAIVMVLARWRASVNRSA